MNMIIESCAFLHPLHQWISNNSNVIRCFPHVINICCDHVISKITNASLIDSATPVVNLSPRSDPERQTFEDACKRDPIALGRDVVRALRASGQRRELLDTIIDNGNKDGFFFVGASTSPVQVQHLQLLRDVKTRWDSVYYMIRRLRLMRPVCDFYYHFF